MNALTRVLFYATLCFVMTTICPALYVRLYQKEPQSLVIHYTGIRPGTVLEQALITSRALQRQPDPARPCNVFIAQGWCRQYYLCTVTDDWFCTRRNMAWM
ncbi:TPA: hypothetical protein ACH3X3_013060 [Trebouxia sp. C0006]